MSHKLSTEEQRSLDTSFLHEIEILLRNGDITLKGVEVSSYEANKFVRDYAFDLMSLGRDGWNPYDAVSIIEGNYDETDLPEEAEKYKP